MDLTNIFSSSKLKAVIQPAEAEADKALTAAKITTLRVDGKEVSAFEAPLANKIAALSALLSSGEKIEPNADLIAENGRLATEAERMATELDQAKAKAGAQQQEISKLQGELNVANASVQSLTATNGTDKNLLKASNDEVRRLTGETQSANREVSAMCIRYDCLDLRLSKDATEAQKLEAADKISIKDKLTSFSGAVNKAASQVGVVIGHIPSGGAAAPANGGKKLTADEEIRQHKANAGKK